MAKAKTPSFEEAISRLEEIVKSLENGTAQLDKSLSLYEEGIRLVRLCNSKLDQAELKISVLQKGEDGSLTEKDFEESVEG